jgi:hypothetical protein
MLTFLLLAFTSFQPTATSRTQERSPWDELAAEYEHAFEAWAQELSRSGGWEKPESERPPSPAVALWPRFEALADRGEGLAVLWMLDNAASASGERAAVARALFERVRAAGEADWVVLALPRLSAQGFEGDALAHLEGLQADTRPKALRVAARLAQANLVAAAEPARAADLRVRAALLEHRDVEVAPGEELASEDVAELADAVIDALEEAQRAHFERAYFAGSDGTYYPRAAAPPDPEVSWKPVVETLAERGSARARFWALTSSGWQLSEAEKERLRGYLDVVCREPLPEEWQVTFGYEIGSLVYKLGLDFVEPRVRGLVERTDEAARPRLLFGLGDALCERGEEDPAALERGLALLREVQARWPGREEAQDAEGRIFRYTNLVVGKKVPDFEAVDADGNVFRLSDYAGKVTVVDFWGFW